MDEKPWQTPLNKKGGERKNKCPWKQTKKNCKIVTLLEWVRRGYSKC
jgi:hypothetical protein